ncbi:MAG: uroporphyrinogen decarboxylase family protein, partial [Candidatus Humimicrobiaceae bacterium]
ELYKNRTAPLMIGGHPCGFYGSFRILCGDVGISMLYYDDPKLVHDILDFLTDFWISLYEEVLAKVTPDWSLIWEDMAYNSGSMISPATFREFLLPRYKRFTGFLKSHGINNIHIDSDGDTTELIPLWIEGGVTGLYPLEPTGKMDMIKLRKDFPKFQLLGGINKKYISESKEKTDKALEFVPELIRQGGYIPYADHCIVENTSWENMKYYRQKLWEIIENTPVLGGLK